MQLQLLRNATLRLSFGNQTFLIDPWFAPKHSGPSFSGRERNPTVDLPVTPAVALIGVSFAIISHLHADHVDLEPVTLPLDLPIVCQPGDERTLADLGFSDLSPLNGPLTMGDVTVERTDGQHGSGPILEKMGSVMGFVLRAPGEPTVYWAGDTILTESILDTARRVRPDIVITHSGGAMLADTLLMMDDRQTTEFAFAVPDAVVVATHLEAVDHATVSRQDLRRAATDAGLSQRLIVPDDGQTLAWDKLTRCFMPTV